MSYEGNLNRLMQFLPAATDLLFDEYAEAMVSLERRAVVEAIAAKLKLEMPELRNAEDCYNAVERAFYELLVSATIRPKWFNYSSLGNEEIKSLFQKYHVEAEPEIVGNDFADIVWDYNNLPADQLNERRKNPEWLGRFNEACARGVL